MSTNPYIGEIMPSGFNFAPRNWNDCNGDLIAISSNTALFSLIGATFGGDGRTTFALPDLRGRVIKGQGNGPGLPSITWGQKAGSEIHTLVASEMPSHNHLAILYGETASGTLRNPEGNMLASHAGYASPIPAENKAMATESIEVNNEGGGQFFGIRGPYLGIRMSIALFGVYPSRS